MTKEERIELIEAYLNNSLTGKQEAMLEKLQAEDPSFQIELEEHKALWVALGPSRVNAFRQVAEDVIKARTPKSKKLSFFRQYSTLIATIAAVLLVIGAWFFMPATPVEEKLFTAYFKPPTISSIFRNTSPPSSFDPALRIQKEIDSLYRQEDYPQALALLKAYAGQFPEARSSDYYYSLGIMYLLANQPDEALKALALIEVGYPHDKPWYTGLAYLKAGNLKAGKAIFSTIAQSESPYQKEALEILGAIGE